MIMFLPSIRLTNDTTYRRMLGNVQPGRFLVKYNRGFKGN